MWNFCCPLNNKSHDDADKGYKKWNNLDLSLLTSGIVKVEGRRLWAQSCKRNRKAWGCVVAHFLWEENLGNVTKAFGNVSFIAERYLRKE